MSDATDELGHGNSPAAWTAVVVMLVGFAIATAALFLNVMVLVWVGVVLVPVGLIIGIVMARAGFGVKAHH